MAQSSTGPRATPSAGSRTASGWFASSFGWDRHYAASQGVHTPVLSALYSLYEYHLQAIIFGIGLRTPHPYQSQPWDWLLITRPVAFYYQWGETVKFTPRPSRLRGPGCVFLWQ